MGFLSWLFGGSAKGNDGSSRPERFVKKTKSQTVGDVSVEFTRYAPNVDVPKEEVERNFKRFSYVLEKDFPALKPSACVWDDGTQKRRIANNSKKAIEWLQPFVAEEMATQDLFQESHARGPKFLPRAFVALRKIIREKQKESLSYENELSALYGANIASELFSLEFFDRLFRFRIFNYVTLDELKAYDFSYENIGYKEVESLKTTDISWLVKMYGEPTQHLKIKDTCSTLFEIALCRYCWDELRRRNAYDDSFVATTDLMTEFLRETLEQSLTYHYEWVARHGHKEKKPRPKHKVFDGNIWRHTNGYKISVYGESDFQRNLSKIVGGKQEWGVNYLCNATLHPKTSHVEIRVESKPVGYLNAEFTDEYLNAIRSFGLGGEQIAARAKIVGGWLRYYEGEKKEGSFGIKLNIKWPPELAK